jgi:flagellar basal-body rod protein FlgC
MLAGHHAGMDQAGSIALSGLQAASLRLEAAASNIVNSGSDSCQPVTVSQSPSPGGDVRATLQPATLLAYDPSAPYANLQGSVAQQGVDLPTELVNLKLAEHDFRAGLLAYKASAEMFKTLLDATG